MSDQHQESSGVDFTTVGVFRTAATVKGGRRFSFAALVVGGDRNGSVGLGYSKGKEVPPAIEKAEKEARRSLRKIPLKEGTIPHSVTGRFGASAVRLVPASPGTGVVAGGTVRAVLELAGIRDCLTKAYGSTNQKNLVKATMAGLEQLRSKEKTAELRGVVIEDTHVDEFLKNAPPYVPPQKKSSIPQRDGGGRGGRGGRGGKGGGPGSGPRRSRRGGPGAGAETGTHAGEGGSGEAGASDGPES